MHALLFGTNNYNDLFPDLINPIIDANTLARELKDYYSVDVELIENASLEEIMQKLREYAGSNYNSKDRLMIFFAGHDII